MLFLNPLLLQAYKGIDFRPWLRGSLAGITPAEARHVLGGRDVLRRGVLTNVALHARLERKHDESSRDVKTELKRAGFKKELIVANVRRLEKLVRGLEWKPGATEWSGYEATTSYDEADAARKEEFVREVVHTREWSLVWDIGCNEGRHSRIAAENARYVVALDGDAAVVDRLYRSLAAEGDDADPAARGRRHRSVAGARLARARAADARRARQAGADALPRRPAPRRDRRERPRARVPVLARRARDGARDRVPDT